MADCEERIAKLEERVAALEAEREKHVADPAGTTSSTTQVSTSAAGYRYFGFGPQPPVAH